MAGYKPLVEEPSDGALIGFLEPPVTVTLNSRGQHTLEWSQPLSMDGTSVDPGSLNLYTYPGAFLGPSLDIIRRVLLHISTQAVHLFNVPDPVGAFAIHALIVCNSDLSLELADAILNAAPRLLLQLHVGQPFSGEGILHIVCVNRREELAVRMVDLAVAQFQTAEVKAFLSTQVAGVFFDAEPMCWYGESPLAYACTFGLRRLVRRMLDTGLVSLNDNCGELLGFYPLHAVTANGLCSMYDFLTRELPVEQRADKDALTQSGQQISMEMEGMSAVQLAAKRGMGYIFQHVMKSELTRILWVWGPVTQYQISLAGIDSSGNGACDVMEILIREDSSRATQEFILDDFMKGAAARLVPKA